MILSTIVTLAILTAPQEISISKALLTPDSIASFNGVVVEIDKDSVRATEENATVVITDFPLGVDGEVDLRLQRFEIFTEGANVVIGSTNKLGEFVDTYAPRPDVVLLRGTIDRDPSSKVFLALGKHTTNGILETEGKTYVLAHDKEHNVNLVYNLRDVDPERMNWADFHCDAEGYAQPVLEKGNAQTDRSVGGGCQTIQIAVETDWEFTGDLFDGNTAQSSEYATTLMAAVSSIFNSDVGYALQVSFLRLWEDENDPWTGSSTSSQLGQFRSYWLDKMDAVERHLAHFLSGRNLGGGKAYIGAVCTNYGYAVSANLRGSFPIPVIDHSYNNWDIYVVAHETGHNVGTRHTHDYSPPVDDCGNGDCSDAWGGTIMSYCHQCSGGTSNIVLSFAPRVQTTIEAYLQNVQSTECVLDCNADIPGACCVEEICSEMTTGDCAIAGGTFLGSATTCATFSCVEQMGACCVDGSSCEDTDSVTCEASGGVFLGGASDCQDGGCDPDAPYACCLEGSCIDMSQSACSNANGIWNGVGALCASGACDPLSNDFCETAREVVPGSWAFTTIGALSSDEPPDNALCDEAFLGEAHSDVWFRYEACESGNLLVSTCESVDFDSDLVVYKGSCTALVQVGCNGDGAGCGGFTSELNVFIEQGNTYFIRVGGFSSTSVGSGQLVIGGHSCSNDSPCIGDVNLDGVIDVNDLLILLNYWGEAIPEYDFDEDGTVSIGDVLLVFANWGDCE